MRKSLAPAVIRTAACLAVALLASTLRPSAAPGLQAGSVAAASVAGGDIVLGMSAAFTGASGELGINLYRGAQTWFQEINERGGIGGRAVRIKAYDDGYAVDRALANTLTLLERDRVTLLFGYVGTATVTRVMPLLMHHRRLEPLMLFPFTGAGANREPPYDRLGYNLRASYEQETAGLVDQFVEIGRKKIAIFYQADPYGRSGWDGVRQALALRELTLVGEATYRRGSLYDTDMKEQVRILRASGADAVITAGNYAACAAFIRDAVDAGWQVPIANLSFVGSINFIELLRAEGRKTGRDYTSRVIKSDVVPSYDDPNFPAGREYLALTAKHHPEPPGLPGLAKTPVVPTTVGFEGFLNAKLLTEALRRTRGDTTGERLREAFKSLDNFDLGIGVPIVFGASRTQGLDTVYYVRIENGRFVPITDWRAWAP